MKISCVLTLALVCACGGGSGPSALDNGTIRGRAFTATDSAATVLSFSANDVELSLVVTDTPAFCDTLTQNKTPKNVAALIIAAADFDASTGALTPPTVPGTHTIVAQINPSANAKVANLSYVHDDDACQAISADGATAVSGSITFTSIANGVYTGTYDVVLNSNDRVKGSFTSQNCPALAGSSTPLVCT
ncbi:MAG TPA: hypothetical protein VGH20_20265 [Myxococcales bacterium]|jgi:hypothetical protein